MHYKCILNALCVIRDATKKNLRGFFKPVWDIALTYFLDKKKRKKHKSQINLAYKNNYI